MMISCGNEPWDQYKWLERRWNGLTWLGKEAEALPPRHLEKKTSAKYWN